MSSWGFSLLLFLVGIVSSLATASGGAAATTGSALAHKATIKQDLATQINRKLKVASDPNFAVINKANSAKIDLEDYPRFDPAPSKKETIKSGPIEHGTPVMPYIPQQPTPPSHPRHGSPGPPAPSTRAATKDGPI